jgi:hypothetical protein
MLLLLLAVSPGYTQPPTSAPSRTGIQIYTAACAHCHGTDGRGVPADRLALSVPLPDFTDCQFGPREPDSDWSAVIHEGGPVRVFDRTMPAFGDALSSAEIQLAVNHVRSFCASTSWPRGELNFPKALVTEKAFPEDEVIVISSISTEGDGSVSNKVIYEKRLGAQNQIELVIPIAAHAGTTGNWVGGVGDAAFAFKRVLAHSRDRGSIVSLTGELVFPTGSTADSLGKGHTVVEPFLTFGQALPADSFVQFQGGFAFPVDDQASNEAFYRLAVGKTITQGRWGRAWTPMVEFLASRTLADGRKTSWDILPQMQVSLSARQHILMNTGLRVPMTDYGPRKTQFVVYLLWDWYDGGFLQGW